MLTGGMFERSAGCSNPLMLRLLVDELGFFCCAVDVGICIVVFGFDVVGCCTLPPLKLLKFACVSASVGPVESPPDESSDSAPDSEPEFSS